MVMNRITSAGELPVVIVLKEIVMSRSRIRKQFFIPLLACFVLSVVCEGFCAEERMRVSLTARYKADRDKDNGEDYVETERSITESAWESKTETGRLTLVLKNSGTRPVQGRLQWCLIAESFFVVRESSSKKDDDEVKDVAVFDPGNKEITLEPGASVTETITFKPLESKLTNESVENLRGSGTVRDTETINLQEYKGYVAVFTVNGKDAAVACSSSRYRKPEWVNQCVKPPAPKARSMRKGKGKDKRK